MLDESTIPELQFQNSSQKAWIHSFPRLWVKHVLYACWRVKGGHLIKGGGPVEFLKKMKIKGYDRK